VAHVVASWSTLIAVAAEAAEQQIEMITEAAAEMIGESFLCPITFEIIREPAICIDGHSYEKAAIAEWLKAGHAQSPRTNEPLESTSLTSNLTLKQSIQAWNSAESELRAGGGGGAPAAGNATNAEEGAPSAGYPAGGGAGTAKKNNRKKKKKKPGEAGEACESVSSGAPPKAPSRAIEAFGQSLLCPFTNKIMQDPVVCSDGHSYERSAIEERFASGNMQSVKSGKQLQHKSLIPNIQLRQAVEAWLEVTKTAEDDEEAEGDAPSEEVAQPKPKAKKDPLSSESSLERLLEAASAAELTADQKTWFLAKLDATKELQGKLGPSRVTALVEHNPSLALECLVRLASKHHINNYLTALVAMSMTYNSMEVVNRLITAIALPANFIQAYVIKCVRACHELSHNIASQQSFVRLLCVFLYQLIRSKKLTMNSDRFVELQAFCIEFQHVKEAGSLHRLLKTLDTDEFVKK